MLDSESPWLDEHLTQLPNGREVFTIMKVPNRFLTHDTLLSLLLAAACSDANARSHKQPPDVDALLASLLWSLDVWANRADPRGLFAPWNPRVHC